jgi:hypothetical protein
MTNSNPHFLQQLHAIMNYIAISLGPLYCYTSFMDLSLYVISCVVNSDPSVNIKPSQHSYFSILTPSF